MDRQQRLGFYRLGRRLLAASPVSSLAQRRPCAGRHARRRRCASPPVCPNRASRRATKAFLAAKLVSMRAPSPHPEATGPSRKLRKKGRSQVTLRRGRLWAGCGGHRNAVSGQAGKSEITVTLQRAVPRLPRIGRLWTRLAWDP
jgi:hypothetical protein